MNYPQHSTSSQKGKSCFSHTFFISWKQSLLFFALENIFQHPGFSFYRLISQIQTFYSLEVSSLRLSIKKFRIQLASSQQSLNFCSSPKPNSTSSIISALVSICSQVLKYLDSFLRSVRYFWSTFSARFNLIGLSSWVEGSLSEKSKLVWSMLFLILYLSATFIIFSSLRFKYRQISLTFFYEPSPNFLMREVSQNMSVIIPIKPGITFSNLWVMKARTLNPQCFWRMYMTELKQRVNPSSIGSFQSTQQNSNSQSQSVQRIKLEAFILGRTYLLLLSFWICLRDICSLSLISFISVFCFCFCISLRILFQAIEQAYQSYSSGRLTNVLTWLKRLRLMSSSSGTRHLRTRSGLRSQLLNAWGRQQYLPVMISKIYAIFLSSMFYQSYFFLAQVIMDQQFINISKYVGMKDCPKLLNVQGFGCGQRWVVCF